MKDKALQYLSRGWSIIPIVPGGKNPAISTWKEYETTRPTVEQVEKWWTANPTANIGVVCGEVSGILVVDVDRNKETGKLPKYPDLPLSPTLSAKSGGGGYHYFYKWEKGITDSRKAFRKNLDIKGDGGYVVASPSLHESGRHYEWIEETEEISDAPQWLFDIQKEHANKKVEWDSFLTTPIEEGGRNDSATQVAGKIIHDMTPEVWDTLGVAAFAGWNKAMNKPPLDKEELKAVWESVKKIHVKNNPPPEKAEEAGSEMEAGLKRDFKKASTTGTYYLAKYLTEKYNIITIGEKEREMYVYQNGIYRRAENEIIYPEVQRVLQELTTRPAKSDTFSKIADMTSKNRDIFMSAEPNFIPLKNGVYDLDTKMLLPHDPKYRFTSQFPVTYDPDATCPKSEVFFQRVLAEEDVATLQEWLGYYFYRLYTFKKAIILVGEGDTGKTTFLETIINMVGTDNITGVSLHKIEKDTFGAAQLYNKHGNIVDELSAKDITDPGAFKMATGGGSISGEYKYGNRFSFINFAKFTFACNKIPDVKDQDDEAYFLRWMVIRFEKRLDKKIPNFIETLTTEEERSGLFNYAMIGLERLLKQGKFTYSKTPTEIKKEMMQSGSSVAVFCANQIEAEQGYEMTKAQMYDAYADYCSKEGLATETKEHFGRRFSFYVPEVADAQVPDPEKVTSKGVAYTRGWRNVKIRLSEEDKSLEEEYNKQHL